MGLSTSNEEELFFARCGVTALAEQSRLPQCLFRLALSGASTIGAWRLWAASILAAGNPKVILCECGIRVDDPQMRNLLCLACVPLLQGLILLPVIADPGYTTGQSELVPTMSRQ